MLQLVLVVPYESLSGLAPLDKAAW